MSTVAKSGRGSLVLAVTFLTLFSLLFLTGGGWMISKALDNAGRAMQMRTWAECEATIRTVQFHRKASGDSTKHWVTAEYTYEYDGKRYEGSRVTVDDEPRQMESFLRRIHAEMQNARAVNEPITCYANPQNPAEAVLFPHVDMGSQLLMLGGGGVFAAIGGGVLCAGLIGVKRHRRSEARKAATPDEPWRWREEWEDGRVTSRARQGVLVFAVFTIFWNAISWLVSGAVLMEAFAKGGLEDKKVLLVLLFPAIGLIMLAVLVYQLLRWWRYGTSVFRMMPFPGAVGGRVSGVLSVRLPTVPQEGIQLQLACQKRTVSGTSKHRTVTTQNRWEKTKTIVRATRGEVAGTIDVPVFFRLPDQLPETSLDSGRTTYRWILTASASVPGVDYKSTFEVPVFDVPQAEGEGAEFESEENPFAAYEKKVDELHYLRSIGARVQTRGGVVDIAMSPRSKGWVGILGTFAFLAIWYGIVVGTIIGSAPLIFPIAFGLFGLFPLFVFLEQLFFMTRIQMREGQVAIRCGWLARKSLELRPGQNVRIRVKRGLQQGQKTYYSVIVSPRPKESVKVAAMVPSREAADAVVALLRSRVEE